MTLRAGRLIAAMAMVGSVPAAAAPAHAQFLGSFAAAVHYSAGEGFSVTAADLDGDGDVDLAMSEPSLSNPAVGFFPATSV